MGQTVERWGLSELTILALLGRGEALTGYGFAKATAIPMQSVYHALRRFERDGLASAERERVSPHLTGRTPKVVYRGTTQTQDALVKLRSLLSS